MYAAVLAVAMTVLAQVNGTTVVHVLNSAGQPVPGAEVVWGIQNSGTFNDADTNQNGIVNAGVVLGEVYDLTVTPPQGSGLKSKTVSFQPFVNNYQLVIILANN